MLSKKKAVQRDSLHVARLVGQRPYNQGSMLGTQPRATRTHAYCDDKEHTTDISETLAVFQPEISVLKAVAPLNICGQTTGVNEQAAAIAANARVPVAHSQVAVWVDLI